MTKYEFVHVLPNARSCTMSLYVSGLGLSGSATSSSAIIQLNGSPVARLRFAGISPDFFVEPGRLAPAHVKPAFIPMTPLFNPRGLVFPVSSKYCNADRWRIHVALKGAIWQIDRVGIVARFSPSGEALRANWLAVPLAVLVACVLLLVTHVLFDAVERGYGRLMLLLTLGVFASALVTHDEWDFPVWLRFVDLMAFGHANPASMWGGTPLWPLGLGFLAPVLSTAYVASGNASQAVTAIFLKLAMALAACGNALALCRVAKPALRRFLFPIVLLSPYVLYELAGGYRELFAGSFFLLGASLAMRGRFTYSALALAAAASISESLLPLVFLPAALRLATQIGRRSLAFAALDVFAGVAPLTIQWLFLIPHSVAATTLGTRVSAAYRFGGGSWLSTYDGFGVLPGWIGSHSTPLMIVLFALLAAPLCISLARCIFTAHASETVQQKRIFGGFLGLVAAFFLAYRGIDPSTWYALWIVAAFYFMRFAPLSPFPLFLSAMQAVAFYAILGIGDFADSNYVMPSNQSLVGVLGAPMLVSVFAVNLTILALYISRVAGDAVPLFGRGSTWFLLLFLGAFATSAVKIYALDIVFCFSAAISILLAFRTFARRSENRAPELRSKIVDYVGLGGLVVTGAFAGTHNEGAGLVAFIALLLGLSYGFGMCDVVLAISGTFLLGAQYGFGWVSIAGYIVLSLMTIVAIRKAYAASSLREA